MLQQQFGKTAVAETITQFSPGLIEKAIGRQVIGEAGLQADFAIGVGALAPVANRPPPPLDFANLPAVAPIKGDLGTGVAQGPAAKREGTSSCPDYPGKQSWQGIRRNAQKGISGFGHERPEGNDSSHWLG